MSVKAYSDQLVQHPARMETLLSELIETGVLDPDLLVIRPQNLFKRGYSRDILSIQEFASERSKKKQPDTVQVDVCREGFYDMLPEFLFHAPDTISGYKKMDRRVQESEQAKEEEANARKFFLPLEQEFFRLRLDMEQEERTLLSGFSNPMQRALFDRFWTDVKGIGNYAESILFYLLPLAHKIAGNRLLMTAGFQAVLREQVQLEVVSPCPASKTSDHETSLPGLGGAALGFDFVMGAAVSEDLPDLLVRIGPIDLDVLPDYLDGGNKTRLLTILYSYFVPAEMEVSTEIILKKQAQNFVLNEDAATGRLAYSTYL